jgi:WD40 repeat protein
MTKSFFVSLRFCLFYSSISFYFFSRLLVTCSADNTVIVNDVTNIRAKRVDKLCVLDKHTRWVWDCVFTKDGNLVTASADGRVLLYLC